MYGNKLAVIKQTTYRLYYYRRFQVERRHYFYSFSYLSITAGISQFPIYSIHAIFKDWVKKISLQDFPRTYRGKTQNNLNK